MTVGERNDRNRAQDTTHHGGKVLRLRDDGTVPPDNPFVGRAGFKPEIYSYGHRNLQGLAVHPETGALWETEHGPQGGDELNLIQPGKNYGWPVVTLGREYPGEAHYQPAVARGHGAAGHGLGPVDRAVGHDVLHGRQVPGVEGQPVSSAASRACGSRRVGMQRKRRARTRADAAELRQRIRDVRQGPDGFLYLVVDASPGGILKVEPVPASAGSK